jgi:putative hydrolase of HD superfamily
MNDPADAAPDRWLALLRRAGRLKTVPRTGWHLRGVPRPESVADHSWGAALVALVLCEMAGEMDGGTPDVARVLALAVLHDLPESVTGDVPRVATRLLPDGARDALEAGARRELLRETPAAARWAGLFDELADATSPEARIVHDADRLDLLLQAHAYAETTGNRRIEEFWQGRREEDLHTAAGRALFRALLAERGER